MIEIAYQVSLGLMTNGFTLHETLAIAVARRKTAPVEVTGPKREDTMVTRFLVDREAKVDVPDYMEPVARDRPAFLQSLGSQFFFTSMDLTAVCAGEKNQDSSSLVAIDVRSWNHESVGQTEELNNANAPIAWRSGGLRRKCEDTCNITHVACLFARRPSERIWANTACGLHLADHKRKRI
jgi:hypothetical protein